MLAAPQHRPRPLPLFLALLRSMTEGEPARMRAALAGLKKYQEAPRELGPDATDFDMKKFMDESWDGL